MESQAGLWQYASMLKSTERRGWKKLPLKRVESVADHSFALSLLALQESERQNLNVEITLKMALLHDLEEALTGDLTPMDKERLGSERVKKEKQRAIERILKSLPVRRRSKYRKLWTELGLLRTKEARLVHDLDKLEMAFQANEYAKKIGQVRIEQFFSSAKREILDPRVRRALPAEAKSR